MQARCRQFLELSFWDYCLQIAFTDMEIFFPNSDRSLFVTIPLFFIKAGLLISLPAVTQNVALILGLLGSKISTNSKPFF